MAVKLRLMRMGKKKQPTYRVVAADSRSPRNGRFIEFIGTYEPRQDPSVIKIDNERAVHWLANGAQPTDRVEKLLKISGAWTEHTGEAFDATVPERAARKSKKQLEKEAAPLVGQHVHLPERGRARWGGGQRARVAEIGRGGAPRRG